MLYKTICCDPSSEPSRRDGSDEGSQHMVSMRNKKNYHKILPLIWGSEYREVLKEICLNQGKVVQN